MFIINLQQFGIRLFTFFMMCLTCFFSSPLHALDECGQKGGKLKLNESQQVMSLFPLSTFNDAEKHIVTQLYEGLVKFNPKDISIIEPSLATSWTWNDKKTIVTFNLRKNVFFHDDACFENGKGRAFTAEDVKFCMTQLCTKDNWNFSFSETIRYNLVGANQYFNRSKDNAVGQDLKGVKVIDKHTVQFHLLKPNIDFLKELASYYCLIFPKEFKQKYKTDFFYHAVGTGPFLVKNLEYETSQDLILLEANPNYYLKDECGNRLPYLDTVEFRFCMDKKLEMKMFHDNLLDVIYTPFSEERNKNVPINTTHSLDRLDEMSTYGLFFDHYSPYIQQPDFRKALSYSIEHSQIIKEILKDYNVKSAKKGITPSILYSNDSENIPNKESNTKQAIAHLKAFHESNTMEEPIVIHLFYAKIPMLKEVANEIKAQWSQALGLDVIVMSISNPLNVAKCPKNVEQMYLLKYQCDNTVLDNSVSLFYSENYRIMSGDYRMSYQNSTFDKLFRKAITEKNTLVKTKKLIEAEQLLIQDCPMIPLWHGESIYLSKKTVKNFSKNGLRYYQLTKVYLTSDN